MGSSCRKWSDIFSASLAHEEEEHEIRVVEKVGSPDLLIFAEG